MTKTKRVGIQVSIMLKGDGLHCRFFEDIMKKDILWMSGQECTEGEEPRTIFVKHGGESLTKESFFGLTEYEINKKSLMRKTHFCGNRDSTIKALETQRKHFESCGAKILSQTIMRTAFFEEEVEKETKSGKVNQR